MGMATGILSNSKNPVLMLDREKILACNQVFQELVQRRQGEIIGKRVTQFIYHPLLPKKGSFPANFHLFFEEINRCELIRSDKESMHYQIRYHVLSSDKEKWVVLELEPLTRELIPSEELQKYVHFYIKIANILPDIAFIQKLNLKTNQTMFLYVNQIAAETFGFTLEEIQKIEKENDRAFFDFIHPDDRDDHMPMVISATERKNIFSRIMKMLTRSGEVRYLYVNSSLYPMNEDVVLSFGVARDITELINQHKKIEYQNELLTSLSEISSKMISSQEIDFQEIMEILQKELSAGNVGIFLESEFKGLQSYSNNQQWCDRIESFYEDWKRLLKDGGNSYLVDPEGLGPFPVSSTGMQNHLYVFPVKKESSIEGILALESPSGSLNPEQIHFFVQVASFLSLYHSQHEAVLYLQRQYHSFSHILDNIPAAILLTDPDDQILFSNQFFRTAFSHYLSSDSIRDYPFYEHIKNQKKYFDEEKKKWFKAIHTTIDWFQIKNARLYIFVDITDNENALQELRIARNLFETLVNNLPVGLMHVDKEGRLLYINDTYMNILHLTIEDVSKLQKTFHNLFSLPSLQKAGLSESARKVLATGESFEESMWIETLKNERKYMHYILAPLKDEGGQVNSLIWLAQDLTDLQMLQIEKNRNQLMHTLGMLSAGIAHDFNNLLTGIMGNLSLAEVLLKQGNSDKALKSVQNALLTAEKSKSLSTQLLSFARGGIPDIRVLDAEKQMLTMVNLLTAGTAVKVNWNLKAENKLVRISEIELEQVINNLVTNAIQAMQGKGELSISLWNEELTEEQAGVQVSGKHLVIEIRDTGPGIPPHILPHIFDPFVTTKAEGSGLGLATTYAIINKHRGMIRVHSKIGEGAFFRLYLPIADIDISKAKDFTSETTSSIAPAPTPGHRKILVMDDEKYIRQLISEILKVYNHEIVAVERGEEALQSYQKAMEQGKPFDLVILDLTIKGGMGGIDTYSKLRELNPQVKVILTTGYADNIITENYDKLGLKHVLQKPFSVEELINRISEVLGQS